MKISTFQIVVLGIFILAIIGGVIAFATFKGAGSANTSLPSITVWGTFPTDTFNRYVTNVNMTQPTALAIQYVQKDPTTFNTDLVNAIVTGHGPDAILVPADMLLPLENKLTLIPYSAYPQRTFMDTYIQEADVYLQPKGILALPFTVDPLIMYWNRDMFNAAGIPSYPQYWDEFQGLNQKLTSKSSNGTITTSALAMGEFSNITHAREVLGSLLLQAGNPITSEDSSGAVSSTLIPGQAADPTPVVQFFSQFANPANPQYSWNKSMPNDKSAFLGGTLATYFGFASEIADLRAKNANLNFDVAPLPQVRSGGKASGYGLMYGFSLVRTSANANAAYQILSILTSPQYLPGLAQTMYLPTVVSSLDQGATDPYLANFDREALITRTWLDAGPTVSSQIMGFMIGAVTSGQKTITQAIQDAQNQYNLALKQAIQ